MGLKARARTAARKVLPRPFEDNCGADRGTQHALALAWRQHPDLDLRDVEFRNTSQNGEDGILLYLLTQIGHGTRRAVELCAGDGITNNTANLVLHHDWDALMIDGDTQALQRGRDFYRQHPETSRIEPTLAAEWVTVDNVNQILNVYGYTDADVLSLDMDGVDYWILEALDIRPRLIVVEYNLRIPADQALTVPYDPNFSADVWQGYFGASLAAFNKLLSNRGYRLVGANRPNTNAIFLRNDQLPDRVAVSVESCLESRWAVHHRPVWDKLSKQGWVEV